MREIESSSGSILSRAAMVFIIKGLEKPSKKNSPDIAFCVERGVKASATKPFLGSF